MTSGIAFPRLTSINQSVGAIFSDGARTEQLMDEIGAGTVGRHAGGPSSMTQGAKIKEIVRLGTG
jgi:hypothetical protein